MSTKPVWLSTTVLVTAAVSLTSPVGANASSHTLANKTIHHVHLSAKPYCISVGHSLPIVIGMTHGVKFVRYTFALTPLFSNHRLVPPSMGTFKANQHGDVFFFYRVPTKKKDAGRWQLSATRRMSHNFYKLAAVSKLIVKAGRCQKPH
jgi:hypothetical protein